MKWSGAAASRRASSSSASEGGLQPLQGGMRNVLVAILVSLVPASAALAESNRVQSPGKPAATSRQLPLKGAAATNACAAYGAGFVRVAGSETCVRVGGAVSVEAGARR